MKNILLLILSLHAFSVLAFDEVKLKSTQLLINKTENAPVQNLLITFPFGSADIKPKYQGTLSVLANVLGKGPKNLTEYQYEEQLFKTNSSISFSTGVRTFNINIKTQKENLSKTLELLNKILKNPNMNLKNFEEAKQSQMTERVSAFGDMRRTVFYYALRDVVDFHPFTLSGSGSPRTIKKISYKMVEKYLKKLDLNTATFYGLGPAKTQTVKAAIDSFLTQEVSVNAKEYKAIKNKKNKNTIIVKDKATDHQLLFATSLDLKAYTYENVVADVANNVLGGGLSGRLAKTLRVERGLTYHAGSYLFPLSKDRMIFFMWTFGGSKQIKDLYKGIPEVLETLQKKGLLANEIKAAKQILKTRFKSQTELPKDRLSYITKSKIYGYPIDALDTYLDDLEKVTPKEVMTFIKTKLFTDKMSVYSMGDPNIISPMFNGKSFKLKLRNIE